MELLLESVKLVPYNWSAWLKLTTCLEGSEEVRGRGLPSHAGECSRDVATHSSTAS